MQKSPCLRCLNCLPALALQGARAAEFGSAQCEIVMNDGTVGKWSGAGVAAVELAALVEAVRSYSEGSAGGLCL